MLVLLIIFMITAPLMAHKIVIDLPEATAKPNIEEPKTITLAVRSTGEYFWNDEPIVRSAVDSQLRVEARREPQPEVQIRADRTTEYKVIVETMAAAKNAGMKKVGLITTPGR
jgi:biopolymer transport protein ExbD